MEQLADAYEDPKKQHRFMCFLFNKWMREFEEDEKRISENPFTPIVEKCKEYHANESARWKIKCEEFIAKHPHANTINECDCKAPCLLMSNTYVEMLLAKECLDNDEMPELITFVYKKRYFNEKDDDIVNWNSVYGDVKTSVITARRYYDVKRKQTPTCDTYTLKIVL